MRVDSNDSRPYVKRARSSLYTKKINFFKFLLVFVLDKKLIRCKTASGLNLKFALNFKFIIVKGSWAFISICLLQ